MKQFVCDAPVANANNTQAKCEHAISADSDKAFQIHCLNDRTDKSFWIAGLDEILQDDLDADNADFHVCSIECLIEWAKKNIVVKHNARLIKKD